MGLFGKEKPVNGLPRERPRPEEQEKPKPVIERLPKNIVQNIDELTKKKNGLLNQFLQLSAQIIDLQGNQKATLDNIKSINKSIGSMVKKGAKKLRIVERKEYRWRYDDKIRSFVGFLAPKPKPQSPKVEPPKK